MGQRLFLLALSLVVANSAAGQSVLFDGLVNADREVSGLLIPAVVTDDYYSVLGRLEIGLADRVNLFPVFAGRFNDDPSALAGVGWAGTFYRQTDTFPVNFGFFNSFVFPFRDRGPDAFITLAPVLSHSWKRKGRSRVTPYGGVTATLKVNGRGSDANALIGVKVTEIADDWDFIAEVQAGEESLFAVGFSYRF